MRTLSVVLLLALLAPAAAFAQGAASGNVPPAARATRGGDISRDEYVQRAVDRARRAAETRFDRMDANHDGILTADERRAARAAKRGGASQPQ
jgi:hypothetical protein